MHHRIKIGMIGLDTSHVSHFTQILHDTDHPHHIPGAQVVAGTPAASSDMERSWGRVEQFTKELSDQGVSILDSARAVAEASDVVFITAVDGRTHRQLAEQVIPLGKPTFIDKPLATSVKDAQAILDLGRRHDVPVMSTSALRYSTTLVDALKGVAEDPVVGVDVCGPMKIEPPMPGLFFYGVHCVEMVVAAMGTGCVKVNAHTEQGYDLIVAQWGDGRVATIRGDRQGHQRFGGMVHRRDGVRFIDITQDTRPFYAGLLEDILASLTTGVSGVPAREMMEVTRIIEAANHSRETGEPVTLDPVDLALAD